MTTFVYRRQWYSFKLIDGKPMYRLNVKGELWYDVATALADSYLSNEFKRLLANCVSV
jgi:hypothetical protein